MDSTVANVSAAIVLFTALAIFETGERGQQFPSLSAKNIMKLPALEYPSERLRSKTEHNEVYQICTS